MTNQTNVAAIVDVIRGKPIASDHAMNRDMENTEPPSPKTKLAESVRERVAESRLGDFSGPAIESSYIRTLTSLWIYAYFMGISSEEQIARLCASDPAFRRLANSRSISARVLRQFRLENEERLGSLFAKIASSIDLDQVTELERD